MYPVPPQSVDGHLAYCPKSRSLLSEAVLQALAAETARYGDGARAPGPGGRAVPNHSEVAKLLECAASGVTVALKFNAWQCRKLPIGEPWLKLPQPAPDLIT
eukprot:118769-Hanusia_phi.AAC.1